MMIAGTTKGLADKEAFNLLKEAIAKECSGPTTITCDEKKLAAGCYASVVQAIGAKCVGLMLDHGKHNT